MSSFCCLLLTVCVFFSMGQAIESTILRSLREASQMAAPGANWEYQMLELLNEARSKAGVHPLCLNVKLGKAAVLHSQYMARTNDYDHITQRGVTSHERIKAQGFAGGATAENIAKGQQSVDVVVREWMASPGHLKNILNPKYRFVGFGFGAGNSRYWTQNFGGASSSERCSGPYSPSTQAPAPAPATRTRTRAKKTPTPPKDNCEAA